MRKATEAELAYCAGVIDSDGAIMMQILRCAGKTTRYRSVVAVGQIRRNAVDLFAEIFGGKVFRRINQSGKSKIVNVRPMFHWSVSHVSAAACLRELLPHLRIKVQQAELAILAAEVVSEYRIGKARSQSELIKLEAMWIAMKELNTWNDIVPFAEIVKEVSGPSPQRVLFGDQSQ